MQRPRRAVRSTTSIEVSFSSNFAPGSTDTNACAAIHYSFALALVPRMKLRHPGLIKLASLVVAVIVKMWMNTVRIREYTTVPGVRPGHPEHNRRFIYAFWHETILSMAARCTHYPNVAILISHHADGELIAQTIRWLGMKSVRGSTSKGGTAALMQMLEASHRGHLAITPDGPRGPRREVQLGTIYMASRTGFPIVPIGISYERAWYANSWDRFGVPWPFSRGAGVAGEPLHVPPGLAREDLEPYAKELKKRIDDATELARLWMKQSRW